MVALAEPDQTAAQLHKEGYERVLSVGEFYVHRDER